MASRSKRKNGLLPKQRKFTKYLIEGKTQKEASILTGYSESHASRLANKAQVREALDKAGLSDKRLAEGLSEVVDAGLSKRAKSKATVRDSVGAMRLAYELKGGLTKDTSDNKTQNNIYIKELRTMDNTALMDKVNKLTDSIKELGSNAPIAKDS